MYDEPDYDDYNDPYPEWDEETDMSRRDTYRGLVHAMMTKATGCAFILMMEEPHWTISKESNFGLYPRFTQPCYGELRKYESSHPGDCTQPLNNKPGDLTHPFPDGKPVSLGLPFWQSACEVDFNSYNSTTGSYEKKIWRLNDDTDEFFKEFFQNDNPWKSGFGGAGNVEFYYHDCDGQQRIGGVVLKTCIIDPTVTVQMCWFFSYGIIGGQWIDTYKKARAAGLTKLEAYAFLMVNNGSYVYVNNPDTYHYSGSFSARRFIEQSPNDLTGGTLENRYDYNRTDIQDLWTSNFHEGDAIEWRAMLTDEVSKLDDKDEYRLIKAFKVVFDKVLESEPPITNVPFIPQMTGGKTKPEINFYISKKKVAA